MRNNLGAVWEELGKYEKAIEYYQKAYSVFRESLGEDHPNTKATKKHLEQARNISIL